MMLQRSIETPYQVTSTPLDGNGADAVFGAAPVVQLDGEVDGGGAFTIYAEGNVFDGGVA